MKLFSFLLTAVLCLKYENHHVVKIHLDESKAGWLNDVLTPFESVNLWEDITEATNQVGRNMFIILSVIKKKC